MERLRFATVGSVDDGKSTLIGRLLYDSKSIFEDQLEHIEAVSKRRGDDYVDLSLLTDGLRAEREQGITIDVAYRYFATPKRSFIIADCPGHIQYTRNMITGASNVDLAIVLIDARTGRSLWSGRAKASNSENRDSSGNGIVGILVSALIQQVANNIGDPGYQVARQTSFRLFNAGLLPGPRSPNYEKLIGQ
jgi:hypothetical protein